MDEAGRIKVEVANLKERFKLLKKERTGLKKLNVLEEEIRDKAKAARDLEIKAADIDAAVYDLKAVNPHSANKTAQRTPSDIISGIEEQGRIVSEALARLKGMLRE